MIFLSHNLKDDILRAAGDSTKNRDDVILTFREYNDMLTKIYYLEGRTRWLESVNKHLGKEIESLQNQLLSKKFCKVRCICKLKRRMCSNDSNSNN